MCIPTNQITVYFQPIKLQYAYNKPIRSTHFNQSDHSTLSNQSNCSMYTQLEIPIPANQIAVYRYWANQINLHGSTSGNLFLSLLTGKVADVYCWGSGMSIALSFWEYIKNNYYIHDIIYHSMYMYMYSIC